MPPTGNQDSTGEVQGAKPQAGVPDTIDDILLPKKEVHTPASAQRVNAGSLLGQEQQAAAQPLPQEKKAEPAPEPPVPPKDDSLVKPLQTYRGAIESVIQEKKVSVVSIAADEAKRRAQPDSNRQAASSSGHDLGFTIAAVSGGLVLLAIAAALLAFIFLKPQANAPVVSAVPAPFISVDDTRLITIPSAQWRRDTVLGTTDLARQSTELSLGLMARLYLTQETSASGLPPPAPIDVLLSTVAPNAPSELLRSFTGEYLLGVHSYDGNQAFLVAGVENFEAAYAGMLDWEFSMPQELSPLFTRTPRPRIPEEHVAPQQTAPIFLPEQTGTSTATTTAEEHASSTGAATSTAAEESELPAFFRTQFIDRIVENYDARVVQDANGDILLLWTFLDRDTLVITTNDATLREIISRRSRPPVVPL